MKIFESERLVFRLMDKSDIEVLYDIWGDPEAMRFCGGTGGKARIEEIIEYDRREHKKHGNAGFAIVLKDSGILVGICGGKLDEKDPSRVEVIVHLNKNSWGKGYASEAVSSYISWLKTGKKASYVYASAHPENNASINMLKKCGFTQNGFVKYEDTGFVDEPYFEMFI
jgi:[ribosomal protein S5]-alanine N-acetyltransferase